MVTPFTQILIYVLTRNIDGNNKKHHEKSLTTINLNITFTEK